MWDPKKKCVVVTSNKNEENWAHRRRAPRKNRRKIGENTGNWAGRRLMTPLRFSLGFGGPGNNNYLHPKKKAGNRFWIVRLSREINSAIQKNN